MVCAFTIGRGSVSAPSGMAELLVLVAWTVWEQPAAVCTGGDSGGGGGLGWVQPARELRGRPCGPRRPATGGRRRRLYPCDSQPYCDVAAVYVASEDSHQPVFHGCPVCPLPGHCMDTGQVICFPRVTRASPAVPGMGSAPGIHHTLLPVPMVYEMEVCEGRPDYLGHSH